MNADSVKARLKNFAVKNGCIFQEALTYYGLERTIYRISVSKYADQFVLKGGIFLYAIFNRKYERATTDVDLLARRISNSCEEMKSVFRDILSQDIDDALVFDTDSIAVEDITEFAQFEPGKSLIFYYAGYSNPFCENEENNYVIAGISRVKRIEPTYYYDNTSEDVQRKYAGGFVWQRPVTSTYPDEGFCIPYWKYLDDEDIIERILLKPQNRSPFKYGSREVDNDDAIEVVNQLIAVVDVLLEIGDDTEDWKKRKEWLNSVLNELWTARGPYPGFPSVLESLGLHDLISIYTALTTDTDMKEYMQSVRDFLDGKSDEVKGTEFNKAMVTMISLLIKSSISLKVQTSRYRLEWMISRNTC